LALLLSTINDEKLKRNVGFVKQSLMNGSKRLNGNYSILEQGSGKFDLLTSFYYLQEMKKNITFYPEFIDYLDCPYMWPFCSQPLYSDALPIIFNITILNSFGITGKITKDPTFIPFTKENGNLLDVQITYSKILHPWSGWFAIFVKIKPGAEQFDGYAAAKIDLSIETNGLIRVVSFSFRVKIVPNPGKNKRILWDQYHNLKYPLGYYPRDDLEQTIIPLDWYADHPHTNFKDFYHEFRNYGYFFEIIGQPTICIKNISSNYGISMIVDSEDEFFKEEINQIKEAVLNGTMLMIFADWYNETLIQKIQFTDDDGKQWLPETGGSNIPGLNALLEEFGIVLGDTVLDGQFLYGEKMMEFKSGVEIIKFPKNGLVGYAELMDIGENLISGKIDKKTKAIFGITKYGTGYVTVFGDSNCLENGSCFELVKDLLEIQEKNLEIDLNNEEFPKNLKNWLRKFNETVIGQTNSNSKPKRLMNQRFFEHSKVVKGMNSDGNLEYKELPECQNWKSYPGAMNGGNLSFAK
uniref:Uncharacterized protein n=1 Tax=Panagrolaimus sp. JU765 TaxID=591449 RepID=A0AC34RR88_9BILA